MSNPKIAIGIRFKLSVAFMIVSLVIAGFVIGAVNMQLKTIERATLLETEHFVGVVAYAGADNALSKPDYLQNYADRLHASHGRDLAFVDANKKGIADADREEIGEVFNHDPGDEVGKTLRDGQIRVFIERNERHPQGIKQVVIPVRQNQADANSAIVGAAIVEYSNIYDRLLATQKGDLYLLGLSGIGCVLLSMIFGLRIAALLARRIKGLQDATEMIAAGNYETKVSVTSRDEVGRLGAAFNAMAGALKNNNALSESELRFRALTEMSSDFYWETDAEHRLSDRSSADFKMRNVPKFQQGPRLGERRWEIPSLSPDEAGWREHRATLDAHRPFRNFELSRLEAGGSEQHTSISGDPMFGGNGAFRGYRGVGHDITESKLAQEQAQRFKLAMDGSADMIVLIDRKTMRFVDVNPAVTKLLGYSRKEMLAMGPQDVLPVSREELEKSYDALIASPSDTGTLNSFYRCKDGSRLPFESTRRVLRSRDTWIIAAISRDIRERVAVERALRDSSEQLRLVADNIPAMIAYWDESGHCRFASRAFAGVYGFDVKDIIGKHIREIMGEDVGRDAEDQAVPVRQGHPVTYQRKREFKNGEFRFFEIRLLPHFGEHGKVVGCFAVTIDITEHKLTEERIQRVAHHDSLTGLPNRLLFNDRLLQAISLAKRHSRQFALLYLDLNRFKPVNDAFGHAAGDELLKEVAARIGAQVRESDTVARVGGDEFTVILTDVGRRADAEIVVGKIIAALAAPFELGSQKKSIDIGASVGIAIYPTDARNADALVKTADAAMYSAKRAA